MRCAALLALLCLGFCTPCPRAFAQGSDSCATAQPISGVGTFAFDNTLATTDGSPAALCYSAGYNQMERDVWFAWTANASGLVRFETCSLTAVDTWIALLDAPCGSSALGCNDDTCGFQSSFDAPVAAGVTYWLRVGVFPGKPGGTGSVAITQIGPPSVLLTSTHPTTGHVYKVLSACTWKEAELIAQQTFAAHLATVETYTEMQYILQVIRPQISTSAQFWIGLNDVVTEGTFVWSSGSTATYSYWDPGEPNNSGGNEDYVHSRATGGWNDAPLASSAYGLPVYGLVEIGCLAPVAYCTAGTTTSGCVPTIAASGAASASAASGFTITVGSVEGQSNGLLFYSVDGRAALPWGTSASFMCVKSPLERMPIQSTAGTAGACDGALSIDWNAYRSAHPGALGQPFAPGDVVQVQGWFRDPPSPKHTNLSNALEFPLCP